MRTPNSNETTPLRSFKHSCHVMVLNSGYDAETSKLLSYGCNCDCWCGCLKNCYVTAAIAIADVDAWKTVMLQLQLKL